jgi:hypothetical protein
VGGGGGGFWFLNGVWRGRVDGELLRPLQGTITKTMAESSDKFVATDDAQLGMPLPPFNRDAATPAEAYPLSSLIGKDAYEALRPDFQLLAKATPADVAKWRQEFFFPEFILAMVEQFPKLAQRDRNDRAKLLTYAMHLLTFKTAASSKRGAYRSSIDHHCGVRGGSLVWS